MKLCIPEKILDQHVVVLGKTGAGKSSVLRHIVEHLLQQKKRVAIIDPKGDWWGLKTSADGKHAGFPVIAFGDFKEAKATDVPINDRSGKEIAELIAGGNRPCMIGMRGWTQGGMTRFWIDFAQTLFAKNAGELFLVGDEFHNFAPKQWKGQAEKENPVGVGLHWSNRLLSEGRGLGLVCLIASQRPQKVHNDTLTSCESLLAMRVVHAADRAAIKAWIDGNGDAEVGKQVLNTLASLARGEPWVWSPEIGFGPERVQFPMFETFDSFAPPQLQKKVSSSGWADVDLVAVKEKLASVIEEKLANDPAHLKAETAKLRGEVKKLHTEIEKHRLAAANPTIKVEAKRVEIPVLKDGQIKRFETALERLVSIGEQTRQHYTTAAEMVAALSTAIKSTSQPTPVPAGRVAPPAARQPALPVKRESRQPFEHRERTHRDMGDANVLAEGERKVLTVAAQYPDGATKEQITILTGYKRSTRDAYVQRLRTKGYVGDLGKFVIPTPEGMAALGDGFQPLPTGEDLRNYWLERLPEGQRKVLEVLLPAYPESVDREAITEATGYKRSTRDAYLQRLGSRRLVDTSERGGVRASETLFG